MYELHRGSGQLSKRKGGGGREIFKQGPRLPLGMCTATAADVTAREPGQMRERNNLPSTGRESEKRWHVRISEHHRAVTNAEVRVGAVPFLERHRFSGVHTIHRSHCQGEDRRSQGRAV